MAQRESLGDRNDRPIPVWALKEQKSKIDDEELMAKKEQIGRLEFSKQKDLALTENKTEIALALLRSVFLRGSVRPQVLLPDGKNAILENVEIQEVLQKIADIESMNHIDSLYPKEFRISSDEYLQALSDKDTRMQLLARMDLWLRYIYDCLELGWVGTIGLTSLTEVAVFLHQGLVAIQEHTIDIKKSLKNI